MSTIAPAFITLNPSYVEPGIILPYTQASGAFDLLPDGEPLVRLKDGDLAAYIKRIDLRTAVQGTNQASQNQLPSVSTEMSYISAPTYLIQVRAEYNHHDTATMNNWGVSIQQAQSLGMRQGHFQQARNALLYGINAANGEGLLNTNGATAVSLPADSFGNQTASTYDNGQMAVFLLQQFLQLKTRTNQLGYGHEFTICGPQRILGIFEYTDIVQLTQYQRPGAGSNTTAGMVKDILEMNGDEITWVYDDTLIGKGAGGADGIVITMPQVEKPKGSAINTNEFAKLAPGFEACTIMYCDMAAPREIPTPLPGGAIDILSEWRITPGWGVRPEAITIVSMNP